MPEPRANLTINPAAAMGWDRLGDRGVPAGLARARRRVSRAEKSLEALRANPIDRRLEELETVARAYDFNVRKPGGSHVYFTHPAAREGLSVPARRPIKPVYVRAFVRFVDRVRRP